jgi:hypothetical protein
MTPRASQIAIAVQQGDALAFAADVLCVKFAQAHYGVDLAVARILDTRYPNLSALLPEAGGSRLLESQGALGSARVLVVGVKPLHEFDYAEIRAFGRNALASLRTDPTPIRHVCLTLQGAGFGLDESEAFESEVGGLLDAITGGEFPPDLSRITILERDTGRAARLQASLANLIPSGLVSSNAQKVVQAYGNSVGESLRTAGHTSDNKPYVFVAMPFASEMEDRFHYGISNAVKDAGMLCERADQSSFTGDVLARVKARIASAALVVADLTSANANVYLEVGYAWGCGKQTVLIVAETADLKFDVQGQRCLVYKSSIKTLEEMLRKELVALGQTHQPA